MKWDRRTRHSKIASVLYPNLASQTTQVEMQALAKNERKAAPSRAALLADAVRGCVSPLDGRAKR